MSLTRSTGCRRKKTPIGRTVPMTTRDLVPIEAAASFEAQSVPVAVVRAEASAPELACALLALAGHRVPLAYDALDRWWEHADGAARHMLVFRLANALGRIDSRSAAILTDARWRASVGLPLALATFVLSSRARAARRYSARQAGSACRSPAAPGRALSSRRCGRWRRGLSPILPAGRACAPSRRAHSRCWGTGRSPRRSAAALR